MADDTFELVELRLEVIRLWLAAEERDATIARLREALEFYGAAETWYHIMVEVLAKQGVETDVSVIVEGGVNLKVPGKRAREALGK